MKMLVLRRGGVMKFCVCVFGGFKKSVRSSRAFQKLFDTRYPKKFPLISQKVAQKLLKKCEKLLFVTNIMLLKKTKTFLLSLYSFI